MPVDVVFCVTTWQAGSTPVGGTFYDDYIEPNEFRQLLFFIRRYFELYVAFSRLDVTGARQVSLGQFESLKTANNRIPGADNQGSKQRKFVREGFWQV